MDSSIWLEIFQGIVLIIGGSLSVVFLQMGISILCSGSNWDSNREAIKQYNSGKTMLNDMSYDYRKRINPGLVVNRKTNTWEPVGSLSYDGISSVFE